jgi:hypothetical protein
VQSERYSAGADGSTARFLEVVFLAPEVLARERGDALALLPEPRRPRRARFFAVPSPAVRSGSAGSALSAPRSAPAAA